MSFDYRLWNRGNVELSDHWRKPQDGSVWMTVGICDEPTIVIQDMVSGAREHHVISSRNFSQFERLRPESLRRD